MMCYLRRYRHIEDGKRNCWSTGEDFLNSLESETNKQMICERRWGHEIGKEEVVAGSMARAERPMCPMPNAWRVGGGEDAKATIFVQSEKQRILREKF